MPDNTTPTSTPIPRNFWGQITHQLNRIASSRPTSFDEVREILLDPRYDRVIDDINRNGVQTFDADSAFFAGSGGDNSLDEALTAAGWRFTLSSTSYHYGMISPTGEDLIYTEGDVERGYYARENAHA